jgi:hypothetical protein
VFEEVALILVLVGVVVIELLSSLSFLGLRLEFATRVRSK